MESVKTEWDKLLLAKPAVCPGEGSVWCKKTAVCLEMRLFTCT